MERNAFMKWKKNERFECLSINSSRRPIEYYICLNINIQRSLYTITYTRVHIFYTFGMWCVPASKIPMETLHTELSVFCKWRLSATSSKWIWFEKNLKENKNYSTHNETIMQICKRNWGKNHKKCHIDARKRCQGILFLIYFVEHSVY